MNAPNELQYKLVAYMDAATDLAESIREDVRRNGKISEASILKLSAFMKAAHAVDKFAGLLNDGVRKLQ